MGGFALAAFAWAFRRGQFDHLDYQANVILDEQDLRMERPWESEHQKLERRLQHGSPLEPSAGEWGGSA